MSCSQFLAEISVYIEDIQISYTNNLSKAGKERDAGEIPLSIIL